MNFRRRHDGIAHQRQRRLAQLLWIFNLVLVVGCGMILLRDHWNPEPTGAEMITLVCLVASSWLCLLIAAGIVGWFVDLFRGFGSGPSGAKPPIDDKFLNKHRMSFYYVGVILNLLAIALVTEITGGLAESPFTALLIAFVLTAEQLSRFKSQAKVMFGIGVATVSLMIALERYASDPQTLAPHLLYMSVALAALIGGGLLTLSEKPRNHYVHRLNDPSQVLVYRDADGSWRFAIYDESHRQDPIVHPGNGSDAMEFPIDLEERVIECALDMAASARWEKGKRPPGWPSEFTTCFSLELKATFGS